MSINLFTTPLTEAEIKRQTAAIVNDHTKEISYLGDCISLMEKPFDDETDIQEMSRRLNLARLKARLDWETNEGSRIVNAIVDDTNRMISEFKEHREEEFYFFENTKKAGLKSKKGKEKNRILVSYIDKGHGRHAFSVSRLDPEVFKEGHYLTIGFDSKFAEDAKKVCFVVSKENTSSAFAARIRRTTNKNTGQKASCCYASFEATYAVKTLSDFFGEARKEEFAMKTSSGGMMYIERK